MTGYSIVNHYFGESLIVEILFVFLFLIEGKQKKKRKINKGGEASQAPLEV